MSKAADPLMTEARPKSFTREFATADERACKAHWACRNDSRAFFCAFCGHTFVIGDEYRMVYSNDLPDASGNPLTCRPCWDSKGGFDGLRQIWREMWNEYRTKFKWWWIRD